MIGIYKIENQFNHKIYIGQSTNIARRFSEHKARYHNINNNCYNKPLYSAFRKYGINNFEFSIVEECDENQLNQKEQYWIQYYNSITPYGYNLLESSNGVYRKRIQQYCECCGREIDINSKHKLCKICYPKTQRKIERPSKEDLYKYLKSINGNFTQAAQKFKVSDNAVRKWCKYYDIPYHSKDYKY